MTLDIRWKQRFDNFQRALHQLTLAMELKAQRPLSELEQQGLIQGFEFTHELAPMATQIPPLMATSNSPT